VSVWAQWVAAVQTGADGLIRDRWRHRQPAAAPVTQIRPGDLRMVPLALAAWGAAWAGTWGTAAVITAAAAAVAVALAVAALRRSLLIMSAAMVATVIMGAGVVDVYRLRHGPVALLAEHQAVVSVDVAIRGDLHRVATSGVRAPAAVTKAVTVRVEGRGSTWLVRAPVLVVVTGQQLGKWFETPVGTRLAVQGRLEAPDRGSDVAAVLRVRGSPVVVEGPSGGLRLVERVRAGLRRAVADRRPESRALVPALVLGDTSGLDAALTQDFQVTGLTHLTAVSGVTNE
jgi:competence protein ComEC